MLTDEEGGDAFAYIGDPDVPAALLSKFAIGAALRDGAGACIAEVCVAGGLYAGRGLEAWLEAWLEARLEDWLEDCEYENGGGGPALDEYG